MYHSKHNPLTKPAAATSSFLAAASKKEFGSIGREVKPTVHPTNYTKAHERSGPLSGTATALRELLLL
jgi:hypothetical protein